MQRLKNPLFLAAFASLVYQILAKFGYAPTFDEWQLWVDLLAYLFIGAGVYSRFLSSEVDDNPQTTPTETSPAIDPLVVAARESEESPQRAERPPPGK